MLNGEMSLVDPRPHAVGHNQYYGDRLERYGTPFVGCINRNAF